MRLGFHYHIPAIKKDGNILMPGYLGRFIDSLAAECESITCYMHSPREDEEYLLDYYIKYDNISIIDIGLHESVPKRVLRIPKLKKILKIAMDKVDLMLIRGPSPLLPVFASSFRKKPVALLLVGDMLAGIDDLPQPKWRKELIRLWTKYNTFMQMKAAKRSLTFVNSRALYEQLVEKVPNLIETRTTTLSVDDFYSRDDTCQNNEIHLLYTGRMSRSKGIIDVIEAVRNLVAQGENLFFDMVGMVDKSEPILDEIKNITEQYGLSDRIKYHGYKTLGPDLFEYYKKADIYVLVSQSSFEGFPRTIWEAMAHSLPVIATRVGSIPSYINDAALLINPKSVEELSISIKKLIDSSKLRKNLIRNGILLAKENTLEVRSKEMVEKLHDYVSMKKIT